MTMPMNRPDPTGDESWAEKYDHCEDALHHLTLALTAIGDAHEALDYVGLVDSTVEVLALDAEQAIEAFKRLVVEVQEEYE